MTGSSKQSRSTTKTDTKAPSDILETSSLPDSMENDPEHLLSFTRITVDQAPTAKLPG